MSPFPRWADLVPELLYRIGDHLDDLKGYVGARAACTSWRHALPPPPPTLLVLAAAAAADNDSRSYRRPYAASLTTTRRRSCSFELAAIESGARCVGASPDGWLALSVAASRHHTVLVLLHPVAGVEIRLPPLVYKSCWISRVSKVVFAPRPSSDDFAAAAICDEGKVAYVTAGATAWAVVGPVRLAVGDHLVDLVYAAADQGRHHKVYCLTECGDVHVLALPERRRRQPPAAAAANVVVGVPEFSLLRPPHPADERRPLRCQLHQRNDFRTMRYEECRTRDQDPTIPTFCAPEFTTKRSIGFPYDDDDDDEKVDPPESQERPDHLNAPATIEPLLLSEANNLPFNPATVFAPPYDIVSWFASAKNLVVCEGNLYQVWRNESCTVTLQLPASGGGGQCRRLAEHEILVLRYYPDRRQPCWDVVKDLGGHSFFVGRNNAVSMHAKGVPGLRGNCVYWIGGRGRDQGMIFDMESGRSTPVGLLSGHHQHSTICWYFLSDAQLQR